MLSKYTSSLAPFFRVLLVCIWQRGTFMGYDFVFSTWAFSASASCFLGIAEGVCWTLLANAMIAILTIWMLDLISVVVHLLNNSVRVAASSLLIGQINVWLDWATTRFRFYQPSSFNTALQLVLRPHFLVHFV
jgi:hypothetical protein